MFFEHVYETGLAQSSYVVGCQDSGEAIVIDPKRDIDTYLEIAKKNQLKITHIAETHIHADFLSGSRELAAATGAKLYLSDEGAPDWQYEFSHIGLKNNDVIDVGNLSLQVLHTPGHTPESISFLLTDHPASDKPVMIFTGDFVFVGDVGRPDLLEKSAGIKGSQEAGAKQLFASLQEFKTLPDHIQLWPGHGAGSACGKALGAVPSSTVGYEKISNWALQHEKEEAFIKELLQGQPEPPRYFNKMKQLNKVDRPLLVEVPELPKLSPGDFTNQYRQGVPVIDTRNKIVFDNGFLKGALNLQNNKSLSTWAGWMVDYGKPFIVIAPDTETEEITRKLMRIGLDDLKGAITDIQELNIPLKKSDNVDIDYVKSKSGSPEVQLVDLRSASEFDDGHIPGAENIFVGTLSLNLDKISKDKEVIVYCQTGDRAAIAYSLLVKSGFTNIKKYPGSMSDWLAHNETVER